MALAGPETITKGEWLRKLKKDMKQAWSVPTYILVALLLLLWENELWELREEVRGVTAKAPVLGRDLKKN
jgi:hypothetical protein